MWFSAIKIKLNWKWIGSWVSKYLAKMLSDGFEIVWTQLTNHAVFFSLALFSVRNECSVYHKVDMGLITLKWCKHLLTILMVNTLSAERSESIRRHADCLVFEARSQRLEAACLLKPCESSQLIGVFISEFQKGVNFTYVDLCCELQFLCNLKL